MPAPVTRSLAERLAFVRERTAPAPVPLVAEVRLHQATDVTPLWHATAAELEGWDPAPFWAFPWAGGQALARHVLDKPDLVRRRRVFDFATGSGLVAVAAARAGAESVTACDLDPFCEAAILANAELNGVAIEVRHADALAEPLAGFDVVLAGDVFYERALAERSLAWFGALARRGVLVLVGDPGRLYSPREGVRERATYDVPVLAAVEGAPAMCTSVLEVSPR
jgi:predicted nicotinamide N-methyase